jgi:hypothetical protein
MTDLSYKAQQAVPVVLAVALQFALFLQDAVNVCSTARHSMAQHTTAWHPAMIR